MGLHRTLHAGIEPGDDIYAHKRATSRLLKGGRLAALEAKPVRVRQTFQRTYTVDVKAAQAKLGIPQTGVIGELTHQLLLPYFDAKAHSLYASSRPARVSPIPAGVAVTVGGLHETAGLPGNWALDWIAPAGAPILAVETATVTKLSGHDPADDTWDAMGVYGWSVHYETEAGYRYFWTHLGWRAPLKVGAVIEVGTVIGRVGDQQFRPDHTHGGVTSPNGALDAKRRIEMVRDSPRI